MLTLIAALSFAVTAMAEVPHMINYQGRLTDDSGNPMDTTISMEFTIYDDSTGGTAVWTETHAAVTVTSGFFNILLGSVSPITDTVFSEPERYLGLKVGGDPEISPRIGLAAVAYAHRVSTVDGSTGGTIGGSTYIGSVVIKPVPHCWNWAGDCEPKAACPTFTLKTGTMTGDPFPTACGRFFVTDGFEERIDLDGGTGDVKACGKALFGEKHSNIGDWSFVAGCENIVDADFSTVSGGEFNNAWAVYSNIGGGQSNQISGDYSTISGGQGNNSPGDYGCIAGGNGNVCGGTYAAIPGGADNTANGNGSFAAGQKAHALHHGSFVWADNMGLDFSSTDVNQFLIRAIGGVGINTETPSSDLHVFGSVATGVETIEETVSIDNGSIILGNNSASTGAIDLYLPAAAWCPGRQMTFKKISPTGNGPVNVKTSAPDEIDNQGPAPSTYQLLNQYDFVVLVSDGVDHWYIVSK
jgi:hypothetical protein